MTGDPMIHASPWPDEVTWTPMAGTISKMSKLTFDEPTLTFTPDTNLDRNSLAKWADVRGLVIRSRESDEWMLKELEALRAEVLKLRGKRSNANGPDRLGDDVWRRVMRFG